MKYILAFVGMVIGQISGWLMTDNRVVEWTLGLLIAVAAYQIPGFIKYRRSTPKQLLAFHGPDAPISRSKSSYELRAFLAQLQDGGLLIDFHPRKSDAKVDEVQWSSLLEPEKLTLFQVLAQAKDIDGNSTEEIKFLDRNGALLATYSTANRNVIP